LALTPAARLGVYDIPAQIRVGEPAFADRGRSSGKVSPESKRGSGRDW
jgi:hypothetical protein